MNHIVYNEFWKGARLVKRKISNTTFSNYSFKQVFFNNVIFSNCEFINCSFELSFIGNRVIFKNCNWTNTSFFNTAFGYKSFFISNTFNNVEVENCTFRGVKLINSKFNAHIKNVIFHGNLSGFRRQATFFKSVDFSESVFSNVKFYQGVNLRMTILPKDNVISISNEQGEYISEISKKLKHNESLMNTKIGLFAWKGAYLKQNPIIIDKYLLEKSLDEKEREYFLNSLKHLFKK
jgi:uncharacterized protein YjbI with pentapeptide repeats